MKVGFIGFGEVASTLARGLLDKGVEVYTCVDGRSPRTKKIADKIGVNLTKSYLELVKVSDIVISAAIPSQAINVAREVGKQYKGIYVDINNVSPSTVGEIQTLLGNKKMVDAAIIGSIRKKGLKAHIIASGVYAELFARLNDYGMNITVIGNEVGQASSIKILRSSYTKGVSALLLESLYSAYKMGIDDQVLKYIAETECPEFSESATSRIISSPFHAKRRSEEMDEVVKLISENIDPLISKATAEFFRSLSRKMDKLDERPRNIKEIFHLLDKMNKD
ncbi:MAG: NAD(P)-dependent oxidoreductase [Euryarchaeota archaeon]|nr:NAD(P)-dependent oxidoreductase [Euryarchaeota archaeon]